VAHILVTAMPFAGHVRPMAAVAAALRERGHRVTAYTGAKYTADFARLGCATVSWLAAQDFDDARLAETFPETGRPGMRGLIANVRDVFIGTARGQVDDLQAAFEATPFDAVVGDVMSVGAGLIAELREIPWATVSIVPLAMPSRDLPPFGVVRSPDRSAVGKVRDALLRWFLPAITAPLDRPHRAVRASFGLGPGRRFDTALYSPTLVIATGCSSLEFPRSDLPASVRFVGRLALPEQPLPAPAWLQTFADAEHPIVFVTHVNDGVLPSHVRDVPADELSTYYQRDAKEFYVACSRAMRVLVVTHDSERASPFLPGLSPTSWVTSA
jgi:UDP:flavonoid glycosyltransferase YjiC (YdhE family)